jgi:hypothetical protein
MLTRLAVKYLTNKLKKDVGLWFAYQSVIAMIIYDNYNKYFPLITEGNSPTLRQFCNICANDFLTLWTKGKNNENKRLH